MKKLLLILSCLFVASCASTSQDTKSDSEQNRTLANQSGHSPGAIQRLDLDF